MPDDRRAALEAAFGAAESAAESQSTEASPAEPIEQPAQPESRPEPKAEGDRPRDERGRYLAKGPAEPQAAPDAGTAAPEEKPKRRMPGTWRASLAPKFETLDDEVVAEIERRERDAFEGINQYRTKAQRAESFERAVQPFMATLQSQGLQPEVAVQSLLAMDHRLRYGAPAERAQMLTKLAQDYGVDLAQLGQAAPQVPPEYAQMQQQYTGLLQQMQALQRQQHAREQQALHSEIAQFAQTHKFFDHVREDMAALLQAGRASNVEEAYDRAVWANPETRRAMQAEQSASVQQQRREQDQRAAATAKTAGVSVAGAPVLGAAAPNPQDRRATIAAHAATVAGRI